MQAPIAAAVLAAGVAGPALADVSDGGFGDWDVNDDGLVSRQEFQLGMGVLGVFRRWDSDHDGMLSDEEYRARPPEALEDQDADVWNAWNLDGDDLLEEREVGSGYFGRYDRDGSGGLDRAEWRAFLADAAAQGWLEP
jgi:hypothetical protein